MRHEMRYDGQLAGTSVAARGTTVSSTLLRLLSKDDPTGYVKPKTGVHCYADRTFIGNALEQLASWPYGRKKYLSVQVNRVSRPVRRIRRKACM